MSETNAPLVGIIDEHPLLKLALMHHRNTRGKPITFKNMPYMIEVYADAPRIAGFDGMKAVQTGWSEFMIQMTLDQALRGRTVAYVLPTYNLRNRFVQTRVNRPLATVPYYRQFLPGREKSNTKDAAKNLNIMQIGPGTLLFLSANTENDFVEFSADTLIVDELDQCKEENLAYAMDRLREAPDPQMFRIGNPRIPKQGISEAYERSDRRLWHHTCDHCNERQPLDWFVNFVDKTDGGEWLLRNSQAMPVCRRCKTAFTRGLLPGCWVSTNQDGKRRGYTMSRMDVLNQDIKVLFEEWIESQGHTTRISRFYRSVLGIPYEPTGARLTVSELQGACIDTEMDYGGGEHLLGEQIVAGVDVGAKLNVSVTKMVKVKLDPDDENSKTKMVRENIYVGEVVSFTALEDILQRFNVTVCVIDAKPETRKCQELRDKMRQFNCVVWLCQYYPTDKVGKDDYGMKLDYQGLIVTVDRTQVMDATYDDICAKRRVFPADVFSVNGWTKQMQAPVRVLHPKGDRYIWDEGNAADHYRHADVYDRIASDLIQRGGTWSVI